MNFFSIMFSIFFFSSSIIQASAEPPAQQPPMKQPVVPAERIAQANEYFHREAKQTHENRIAQILQDIKNNGFPRNTKWRFVLKPEGPRPCRLRTNYGDVYEGPKEYWSAVLNSYLQDDHVRLEKLHSCNIAPAKTALLLIKLRFSTPTANPKDKEKEAETPIISGDSLKARLQARAAALEKESAERQPDKDGQ